jgi:putative membrane protein
MTVKEWKKPELQSFSHWVQLFFSGICVGGADIVPGISGGTVAFIIGIYEDLLKSIATFNLSAFQLLFTGKFSQFFDKVAWQFLLAVFSGVAVAFLTLAKLFLFLLNHEVYRMWLYASFMGLVAGSVIYCLRQVKEWNFSRIVGMILAACFAYVLTGAELLQRSESSALSSSWLVDPWIVLCGSLAVSAMLLPGISGSYLLTVLGMYGLILGSLMDWLQSIAQGGFDMAAFKVVFSMSLGIVLGGLLFSRVVLFLLDRFRALTLASLIGFMIGALRAVWPFWSYSYDGAKLQALSPIIPSLSSEVVVTPLFTAVGFLLVVSVERLFSKKLYEEKALKQEL